MSYPTTKGYSNLPAGGNPRQTEAWALTEAARKMADGKSGSPEEFMSAVRLNWRLWTIFQSEISSDTCELPEDMRFNMMQLCNYVDKTTVDILVDPVPQKVDSLININRQLAAGLFVEPASTQEPAQQNAADIGSLTA